MMCVGGRLLSANATGRFRSDDEATRRGDDPSRPPRCASRDEDLSPAPKVLIPETVRETYPALCLDFVCALVLTASC